MTRLFKTRHGSLVLVLLALAFLLIAAGCSKKPSTTAQITAKDALSTARSALSTMAPDPKLLVVQTSAQVSPGTEPVWLYIFGSPTSGHKYSVIVSGGKVVHATDSGSAGLGKSEWASVPGLDEWKVDSDQAYGKALRAAGFKESGGAYTMLMETYVPKAVAKSITTPFVWYVSLEDRMTEGDTGIIEVNATTGATKLK